MSTIDFLAAEIKRAGCDPADRARVLRRISRDYGKGFAELLMGMIEANAALRAQEHAINAARRRYPRHDEARRNGKRINQ